MRVRALLLVFSFAAAAILTVAIGGLGHAAGAHAGWGDSGCTCHSTAPTEAVAPQLEGLSEHWDHGASYPAVVKMAGGSAALPAPAGRNAGGFALDFSLGTVAPADDKTQVVDKTLTHTAAGNDVREWRFTWIAPAEGDMATFKLAVNAVNGDGLNDGLDQWNKKAFAFDTHPEEPEPESEPTSEPQGTPALAFVATFLLGGLVAVLRRRAA